MEVRSTLVILVNLTLAIRKKEIQAAMLEIYIYIYINMHTI